MNIDTALHLAVRYLRKKTPSAALDAEVLLAMAIKKTKEYLLSHPEQKITPQQLTFFRATIHRRAQGWPVAYLTGHQEFYGLDFLVSPSVLIPRPETELLVDLCMGARPCAHTTPLNIADIGTGSGCIAITLAKKMPTAKVWATDISAQALAISKKNSKKHQTKIRFMRGNLLAPLIKTKHWTKPNQTWVITANLPYLTKKQMAEPSIKKEPSLALFGGADGLKYYRILLRQLRANAMRGNQYQLFLEIDPRQKTKLIGIIKKTLPAAEIEIKNDLARQSRLLIINFFA